MFLTDSYDYNIQHQLTNKIVCNTLQISIFNRWTGIF